MFVRKTFVALLSVLLCAAVMPADADSAQMAKLNVVASGFTQGTAIPKQFTGDGADVSPPLAWSPLPAGTKAVAIFCEDPDAPRGTWVHWIAYNFPPSTRSLNQGVARAEKLPSGAIQATNDFGKLGYNGPAPPPGKAHRYYFHVYALSRPLALPSSARQAEFRKAIEGLVLAEGYIMGTYRR